MKKSSEKCYCPGNDDMLTVFISPTARRIRNDVGRMVYTGFTKLKKPTSSRILMDYYIRNGYVLKKSSHIS